MSFKKLLSLVLVLCMVFSFFPVSAFAENDVDEDVIEEVVEEVPAEEPAEAEEPAPEEPVAEEVVEEEIVFEEVVEETETTNDEAADAAKPVLNETTGVRYDTLAEAVQYAAAGNRISADGTMADEQCALPIEVGAEGLDINTLGNTITGTITVSAKNVVLRGKYTGEVDVAADGLTISGGSFGTVKAVTAKSGNITGGIFASVSKNLLAKGYGPAGISSIDYSSKEFIDANTGIEELDFVATVGNVYYVTFENAAKAAVFTAEATVKPVVELLKAPADGDTYEFTSTKQILQIKLNGKVADATAIATCGSNYASSAEGPDSQGITTVKVVPAVAKVGTAGYATFAGAAAAAVKTTAKTVTMVDDAELKLGDTYTLKVSGTTRETLTVVPSNTVTAVILAERVLSPDEAKYAVLATENKDGEVVKSITYSLEDCIASIATKTETIYYGESEWGTAVSAARGNSKLVLNMLANAPADETGPISLAENQIIVIAKNGFTVNVQPAEAGLAINETLSEDGKNTTYKAITPAASVTWIYGEDEYYQPLTKTSYFETFNAAAADAVAKNVADPNAEAYVTVVSDIQEVETTAQKAANIYQLESGSLTVYVGDGGKIDVTEITGTPVKYTSKNVVAKNTGSKVEATKADNDSPYVFSVAATTYTVTFYPNGGKWADGSTGTVTQSVETGKPATKPVTDPVYIDDTKAFVGWYAHVEGTNPTADGLYTLYDFDTPVNGNVDIVALYAGASIELLNGKIKTFDSFDAAVEEYTAETNYKNYKNLVITPYVASTWTVTKTLAGKAVRVAAADLLTIQNADSEANAVAFDATATETFTVFNFETAVAVIKGFGEVLDPDSGFMKPYDMYYATLADAAKAADGTRIVKVLNENGKSYEFNSDDKVTVLKIDYSSPVVFVATSAVEGMGVKEEVVAETTTVPKHVRYSLVKAAASITVDGETTYYDTFANAAAVAVADANATTGLKTIVLLANVAEKDAYTLPYGKQINVEKGEFNLTVVPGHDTATPKYYAVVEKTDDNDVTNYKSVEAVASIDFGTAAESDVEYYATFAEAADDAFVPANDTADVEDALVVKLYKAPAEKDIYTASAGFFVVDTNGVPNPQIDSKHLVPETGLCVSVENISGTVWKLTVAPAVASITLNNGKVEYFNSIKAAVDSDHNSKINPIVLLADELSYELPLYVDPNATTKVNSKLYVDKNGYDDFTVTKVNPDEKNPPYAIVEETAGKVTTYTTDSDVEAYIEFEVTTINPDAGVTTTSNYVYYTDFADAVVASENGEYVIGLCDDVEDPFIMTSTEQVIKVDRSGGYVMVIPDEGLAVIESYPDKDHPNVCVYTATKAIASVTAKFGTDQKVTTKVYGEGQLEAAVSDALSYRGPDEYPYNGTAGITLSEDPEEGFVYALAEDDRLVVIAGAGRFTTDNFTAPDGFAVVEYNDGSKDKEPTVFWYSVSEKVVSVGEGEDIKFFSDFTSAVSYAGYLEELKPYAKQDLQNPTAVITLWKDMSDEFSIGDFVVKEIPPVEEGEQTEYVYLQSVNVKAQGNKVNIVSSVPTSFVEIEKDVAEGVDNYSEKKIVASITIDNVENPKPTYYSTFAAAAEDAHNTENTVMLHVDPANFDKDDIYKMPVGTLKVWAGSGLSLDGIENKIVANGEGASLTVDKSHQTGAGEHYWLFTVAGNEAAIKYPNQSTIKTFVTFEAALAEAKNKNVVIIPLTSLKKDLTGLVDAGNTFQIANSEYDIDLWAENLALVTDGFDPVVYTVVAPLAAVDTDEIIGYNTTTLEPIYRQEYFADFGDAVAYAGSEKVIHVVSNTLVTYKMAEDDVIWVDKNGDNRLDLQVPDGYALAKEYDEENYPNATKYSCGNFTVTLIADEGAKTADGKDKVVVDTFKVGDWIVLDDYNDAFVAPNQKVFSEWVYVPTAGEEEPMVMPEANITYKATWKDATTVTINWVNDGKVLKTTTQKSGEKLAVVGLDQLKPAPTKEGFRPDEGNLWSPEVPEVVPEFETTTATLVFNMNWIKQYNVNFTVDGKSVGVVAVDANDVLANYKNQIPAPEKQGYLLDGWTLNGADFDLDKTAVTADLSLEAKWKAGYAAKAVGTGLNVLGEIGVIYYMDIPEELMNGIYAEITIGDKVVTVPKADFKKSGSNYIFSVSLPAAEDQTTVSLKLINADGVVTMTGDRVENNVYTDSIYGYLKRQEGKDGNFAAFAKAMRNYCEYARKNFGNDPSIPLDLDPIELNRNLLAPFALAEGSTPEGITFAGLQLNLEAATSLRIVFTLASGKSISDYSFTIDGKAATASLLSGSMYYVEVSNIPAAELDLPHSVSINGTEAVSNVSALSYAYRGLGNASYTQNLKETLMALYYYNQAANAYFGA